ncbi:MAG: 30S ribosomal protein S27ae [Candidatus Woesearchaeota archaeon]
MAKKQTKNKAPSKKYEKYDASGDSLKRTSKFCIKCGPGFFMAEHKDRWTCGKCGYTEFKKKE